MKVQQIMNDELFDQERNIMLLLLIAIRGYAEENDELFSVDSEIINDIIHKNIASDTAVPEVAISNEDGRTLFSVSMREANEEEVQKYEAVYGDKK